MLIQENEVFLMCPPSLKVVAFYYYCRDFDLRWFLLIAR